MLNRLEIRTKSNRQLLCYDLYGCNDSIIKNKILDITEAILGDEIPAGEDYEVLFTSKVNGIHQLMYSYKFMSPHLEWIFSQVRDIGIKESLR